MSSAGITLPDTDVPMIALTGDTEGNKTVNSTDVSLTKAQVGMAVTISNFREDVKVSGVIDSADVRQVKADVGHTVP